MSRETSNVRFRGRKSLQPEDGNRSGACMVSQCGLPRHFPCSLSAKFLTPVFRFGYAQALLAAVILAGLAIVVTE